MSSRAEVGFRIAATFALATAAGIAQTRLPLVVARPGKHGWVAVIHNVAPSALTAYVLLAASSDGQRAGHLAESIPGARASVIAIAPGQARSVGLGGRAWKGVSYRVVAAIYANGATAGDPKLVADVLRVRRDTLVDLDQVIPILSHVAAGGPEDRKVLIAQFQKRVDRTISGWRYSGLPPQDRVCQSVLVNLEHPPDAQARLPALADALVRTFTRWRVQLQASKPRLRPLAGVRPGQ